jgi:hypothetical protein
VHIYIVNQIKKMTEKSILEQALLQVNTLEEAVKQNAKGILSSVMKQELNELLKESEEEEEVATEEDAMEPTEEESEDMSEQPDSEDEDEDDAENADDEEIPSINDEPSKDIDDESPETDDMPSMSGMPPMSGPDDDDMLDMTNASDEEVLKVFKAMSDEDGIVVKKDGNNIELKDEDDEYIIKLDESEGEEEETEVSEDWNEEESMEDVAEEESGEETVYEITLDDEEESEMAEEDSIEVEATEAARTKWNKHGDKNEANRAGLKSKKVFAAGAMNEEVENLKKQNAEYKKALVLFKEKLNEVAVFNANLAYATRLFTENSTTKQEKLNILKRFDSISTINESKNLYNSIKSELETKKPVTESVVEKIANTPSSSSSQEMLAESKAYENPQFRRMKDLMSKLK